MDEENIDGIFGEVHPLEDRPETKKNKSRNRKLKGQRLVVGLGGKGGRTRMGLRFLPAEKIP